MATSDHWTPLHYACRYGHLEIVKCILNIPGVTGRRQLLYTVCKYNLSGHIEKLHYLKYKQAIIEPLSILLQIACSFGQVQIVQYLYNGYGSHCYLNDTDIRRLFLFCCKYGLQEIVIQLKSNVSHSVYDILHKTGLHYACQEGHISIAKHLIEERGCDVNKVDRNGYTPLHLACLHGHNIELVKYLLNKLKFSYPWIEALGLMLYKKQWSDSECIDLIKIIMSTKEWKPTSGCNYDGDTVLHLSVKHNRPNVVQYLLEYDFHADPNIRNTKGETPLQQASNPETLRYFIEQETVELDNEIVGRLIIGSAEKQESICVEILKLLVKNNQWNPNSSCNSNGDTALHLAVRQHRPVLACFLLSELKCEASAKNLRGETPIELIIQLWSDLKSTELTIKQIIATKRWDPNSICNPEGDTVLHLSVRYHNPRVAYFLLSEAKCDPNVRNQMGETVIALLIKYSIANMWLDSECSDIFKELVESKQWDPNLSCSSNGDTVLHLCTRLCRCELIYLLLSKAKCNPYIRNEDGETATHLIMSILSSDCLKIIRYITKHWNPNSSCNSEDDTALHLSARYHKPRITYFLLSEAKCNPYSVNKMGETVIKLLMSNTVMWNDYECVGIVKALVTTKHWNPDSSCNSKGDTALHLSARYHRLHTVRYLLSKANSNPNSKNINDETPLQLASDTDIINELIRYGSNPNNVYKLYGKSVRLREPLIPPVKVFIIGNSGVGKSTLTEALKTEAPLLIRAFATRRRVSNIDEKTAGIVPHDFESKNYGHVTFYDFAGHREFYSSHEAFLHNVIQGSSPIFLLVVNISAQNDIIQQNILYWLSFVENQYNAVNCKSHVIVIGSHADIVLNSGNDPRQTAMEISESIQRIFQSTVVAYVGIYPMDCQYFESPGMNKL